MKSKVDDRVGKMVRAIRSGDNVKAYDCLESIVKERVADKIEEALKEE